MDYIVGFIQFILHINTQLPDLFLHYGSWIYAVLFLIIFLESGIVLTPFLPGESMLFALGAMTSIGKVEPHSMVILLASAAILGGFVNYTLGSWIGLRFIKKAKAPFIQKSMNKTELFYRKNGPKAVLIARLIPIIRTFVPFLAGIVRMPFSLFSIYNILGGCLWISAFIYMGYFFGSIPVIQKHFSWFVIAIILISVIPITFELIKSLRKERNATNL